MPSTDSVSESWAVDSLEQTITHLFDAVRYSEQVNGLEEQARALSAGTTNGLAMMEAYARQSKAALEKMAEGIGAEYAQQLSSQITEFVKTAVEQAKSKANSDLAQQLSEIKSKVESEKDKTIKSLESYFIPSPLPLIERVLTVKKGDSGYEANISYSCKGGTKYSFALATANSSFFHDEFTFSLFDKKLSIPIALTKTWIRKEASPRYEKLDRYALAWAEVTDTHTIVDFSNSETQSKVRMVSSTPNAQGLTTVEYSEGNEVTNVTTDTGLNKHLDTKAVTEALLRLRSEVLMLEKNKAALTELSSDGEDILKSLNCDDLLSRVLRLMSSPYRTLIQKMNIKPLQTKKGELSTAMFRERLALLGPSSAIVREALGLR